jgi:outer membrane protein assembly factor BamB
MKSLSIFMILSISCAAPCAAQDAKIIEASGVKGGIAVIVGDAETAATLGTGKPFLVHVLDTDRVRVDNARELIRSKGIYGKVSADLFDGKQLPYVDNLVNLIVDKGAKLKAPPAEVARVLAPRGVFLAPKDSGITIPGFSTKTTGDLTAHTKPVPENIDEWTHFLHGSDNNAVARDSVVGPPKHMQWVGGPPYGRHHDKMSSFTAAVTTGGRVFYIIDEAPPFSVLTAPEWRLVARDAFNGTILWKRRVTKWFNDLHPYKSGPAHLPRKLVADGDRVYTILSLDGPALALDAATGETVRTYEAAAPMDELVYSQGVLFVRKENGLIAVDAASGKEAWKTDQVPVRGSLAVDQKHAVFLVKDRIVCLDKEDGKQLWQSKPVPRPKKYHPRFDPILILYKDVVLWAGGEKSVGHKDHQGNYSWFKGIDDTVNGLSAETGKLLWTAPHPLSGYASSEDLFVIDGVVWCGETTSGHALGHYAGYDYKTGKMVKEFDPDVKTYWFHHRCHRGKATEKYIMPSRTGIEYIDPKTGHWQFTHWVRGACLYGILPANGLVYAPQNPCACFLENRMVGFTALAHAKADAPKPKTQRLEKGADLEVSPAAPAPGSWPTYRCDSARSGTVKTAVKADVKTAWSTEIGGRLSALTVADGKVFVSAIDRHRVTALDEKDGKVLWHHTAGGRVDSPPTIFGKPALCIFGSRDGTITALSAADGKLAWRFFAAPSDRRVMAFEQIESLWPVNGSVLIHDNVLYAAAGRSMFLDGGIRLLRLEPASGKLLSETILGEKDDKGGHLQDYARQHNMPASLPDILSCDGKHVFMRSQAFRPDGTRLPLKALQYGGNPEKYSIKPTQDPKLAHLFCPTGFLDDTWWHRTYWVYGNLFTGGWAGYPQAGRVAPSGRILVFDDKRVYGYGRLAKYYRWTKPIEHHLFAAKKTGFNIRAKGAHHWTKDTAMFPRGMVKAGDLLFLAGPEDIVDEEAAFRRRNGPQWRDKISLQADGLAGRSGGLVRAVKAATGERVSETKIDSIPVFDGMASANGRLYISLADGRVMCME